ncbi:MAG: serine protease Do [Desulfonauticus sp.]|jgi:Do/DeqQ family serine protease|nr:MAG: Peptidase/PDZ domain protein [Desulfonauticus sp. 38_4375]MDK2921902.1 serine protease Do [Desulfonauticus sp.]
MFKLRLGLIVFLGILQFSTLVLARENPRLTPVVKAIEKTAPGVVNVYTQKIEERSFNPFDSFLGNPFWEELWPEFKQRVQTQSLGSGFIVDAKNRYVLTNAHVIEGGTSIKVRLLDGREFEADLVGSDPDFDLAILRLKGKGEIPQVTLGNSEDILIGETVIAIGNPYGFGHTVTTGVVSALKRSIRTQEGIFTDFIQTDAPINPGNSGGPLINILGEVIGINTAIYKNAQGIGFAIPINKAKRAIQELLQRGYVQPVWLGVSGQNLTPQIAAYLGLKEVRGLLLTEVYPQKPADLAGLKPGDVLLQINSYLIEDKDQYIDLLRNFTSLEKVKLKVWRKGKIFSLSTSLAPFSQKEALELLAKRWGFGVRKSGDKSLVVEQVFPGSPASRLGLQPGDVLLKISGVRIKTQEELALLFSRLRLKNTVLLLVLRGDRAYYVRLRI